MYARDYNILGLFISILGAVAGLGMYALGFQLASVVGMLFTICGTPFILYGQYLLAKGEESAIVGHLENIRGIITATNEYIIKNLNTAVDSSKYLLKKIPGIGKSRSYYEELVDEEIEELAEFKDDSYKQDMIDVVSSKAYSQNYSDAETVEKLENAIALPKGWFYRDHVEGHEHATPETETGEELGSDAGDFNPKKKSVTRNQIIIDMRYCSLHLFYQTLCTLHKYPTVSNSS